MNKQKVNEYLNVLFINAIQHNVDDSTDLEQCRNYIKSYINELGKDQDEKSERKSLIYKYMTHCIYSLGVLVLSAFLCWYFDSGWGCCALLLLGYPLDKQ